MPKIVEIKPSHTSAELRRLAASGKNANQSRRLLSIAAVNGGAISGQRGGVKVGQLC
jgi:hypothetical protein